MYIFVIIHEHRYGTDVHHIKTNKLKLDLHDQNAILESLHIDYDDSEHSLETISFELVQEDELSTFNLN